MDIIVTSQQSDPDNSKQVNQKGKSSMAQESNRTDWLESEITFTDHWSLELW